MNFDSAPSFKRIDKKEQGPDQERVKSFVIPITEFIEGKREAIEILRTSVKRDNMGNIRENDKKALRLAVTQVREGLRKRFEPTIVESPNAQEGLNKRITELEKIEELAFAA